MITRTTKIATLLGTGVVSVTVAGGAALAAGAAAPAPPPAQGYLACATAKAQLAVVQKGKCPKGTHKVALAPTGPQGPPGPPGPPGPAGTAGFASAAESADPVTSATGPSTPVGGTPFTVQATCRAGHLALVTLRTPAPLATGYLVEGSLAGVIGTGSLTTGVTTAAGSSVPAAPVTATNQVLYDPVAANVVVKTYTLSYTGSDQFASAPLIIDTGATALTAQVFLLVTGDRCQAQVDVVPA